MLLTRGPSNRGRRRLPVEKIVKEIARANDGPGYQLREEADEQRIVDGIAHGLLFAAIYIHHVRHALKSVETDAQGQHDIQKERMRGLVQHPRQVAAQKIVELEEAEKAEVRAQAQDQDRFPPRTRWDLLQPDTSRVIDCGQSQQQRNEFVIPASVKEITGGQQNILAEGARARVERSEERRVGKECRSRWSPCHSK